MQSIRFYEISDPFIWELSHTPYKCIIYIYLFMEHVDVVKPIRYLQREFLRIHFPNTHKADHWNW